ncbi:unnamed protein product [Chondrus crispus]|uniref:Uncharacterized protein n=1 Tax=Chondrus crispus TaxID=2769 RepID=R7QLP2_CHOCR|nr:unnamed protein product [Chondrus crispus]CDF39422.1 unnamed protein product [Chondrus crispus]|eukprot:XP_005719333.1 unnamed protein product [Chondrus crispus]
MKETERLWKRTVSRKKSHGRNSSSAKTSIPRARTISPKRRVRASHVRTTTSSSNYSSRT